MSSPQKPGCPPFAQFAARAEKICVVGLGYVGLPLAIALAKKFQVEGFDISATRVAELRDGNDRTGEVAAERLQASALRFTADAQMTTDNPWGPSAPGQRVVSSFRATPSGVMKRVANEVPGGWPNAPLAKPEDQRENPLSPLQCLLPLHW